MTGANTSADFKKTNINQGGGRGGGAIQQNQLSELNVVRSKTEQERAKRLTERECRSRDIQTVDLALARIDHRLGVLAIAQNECETSAKSLAGAYLGHEDLMTATSRAELNQKNTELERRNDEIEKLNKSREELTNKRKEKHAAYLLAQQNLEETETDSQARPISSSPRFGAFSS